MTHLASAVTRPGAELGRRQAAAIARIALVGEIGFGPGGSEISTLDPGRPVPPPAGA